MELMGKKDVTISKSLSVTLHSVPQTSTQPCLRMGMHRFALVYDIYRFSGFVRRAAGGSAWPTKATPLKKEYSIVLVAVVVAYIAAS